MPLKEWSKISVDTIYARNLYSFLVGIIANDPFLDQKTAYFVIHWQNGRNGAAATTVMVHEDKA